MQYFQAGKGLNVTDIIIQFGENLAAAESPLDSSDVVSAEEFAALLRRVDFIEADCGCLVENSDPERSRDGIIGDEVSVLC